MKKSIFKSMSIIVTLAIMISCILIGIVMYTQFYDEMKNEVRKEALYVKQTMDMTSSDKSMEYIQKLRDKNESSRFTLIEKDGTVVYDSKQDIKTMKNHGTRPEVVNAIKDGYGEAVRFSETLREQNFYYAVMLESGRIMRVATTTHSVFVTMSNMIPAMLIILIIVLVLSVVMASWETEKLIQPINELNLEHPLDNEVYDELSPLLKRIHRQNQLISKQIKEITDKQGEFSIITENMTEGLIVLDHKERVISVNNMVIDLFKIHKEEYVNTHILSLIRNSAIYNAVQKCMNGNMVDTIIDVEDKNFNMIASPVITSSMGNQELQGAIILIIDITEKHRNEQMRREFSANVSHELKTPLMSISGYAELMKNNMVRNQDIPEFAGRIYHEAKRLTNLVEDIMRLSQLDENEMELQFTRVNLLELAREVECELSDYAHKMDVELEVLGDDVVMFGVRQILKEIIYNLCNNAIKYNVAYGKVTIKVYHKEGKKFIEVMDTGIGITEEDQERIFERFYRVDKSHSKETGGTGLGLSIVKHGVMLHHGRIDVKSKVNKGTTIVVAFEQENED